MMLTSKRYKSGTPVYTLNRPMEDIKLVTLGKGDAKTIIIHHINCKIKYDRFIHSCMEGKQSDYVYLVKLRFFMRSVGYLHMEYEDMCDNSQ